MLCIVVLDTGAISLIFTSPEALDSPRIVNCIRQYRSRICLVAFDEVHCVSEWWVYILHLSLPFLTDCNSVMLLLVSLWIAYTGTEVSNYSFQMNFCQKRKLMWRHQLETKVLREFLGK